MKKAILSMFLAVVVVMQLSIATFAQDNVGEIKKNYYSEQETKLGAASISIIDSPEIADRYSRIQIEKDFELVSVTKQTVYVLETIDQNGRLSESRLMSEDEVARYKEHLDMNYKSTSNTWVGEDNETHQGGKLSIYLVVYKDSSRNYYAYGTVDWENGIYFGGQNGPASGYDFFAITWGGGGELKTSDKRISGIYQYGQGDISFSRAESDTFRGYCWQFDEEKFVYFADYIDGYVKLAKTYSSYKSSETNIRLTYVHTYQDTVGSISFEGGSSGVAAGVSLSNCSNQWQIEIDVPGIYY